MVYLKKEILPKLIKSKSSGEGVPIWIPACSTGQKAYSLAMILMEILGESGRQAYLANEEIVSSNEELQSINEELETSKEEIESANEELQIRTDQLTET